MLLWPYFIGPKLNNKTSRLTRKQAEQNLYLLFVFESTQDKCVTSLKTEHIVSTQLEVILAQTSRFLRTVYGGFPLKVK